jgi:urease accessory protein
MRALILLPALFLLPGLANAHPGHGLESGFVAGAVHPFTRLDHILGIAVAGLLMGCLPAARRWLVCAGFLGLSGVAHVLWTPEAASAGFVAGLLSATAGLVAAGMAATGFIRLTAAARR